MINIDEHKKLLEQVTELERNSINYFDVEKEFFLIDSDNLPQVRPQVNDPLYRQDIRSIVINSSNPPQVRSRLYGYSIQRTGIYEDDNLTPEAISGLDGRGCYVYIEVKDGKITIKQDLNGCWGLYLFRHGDYFALSNSFFRLVDHVKYRYPLTVNRDYCHYFLINDLCSHTYSETAVNEIELLDRSAIVHIDAATKDLELEMIDYREDTVRLDTAEGIETLDRWIEFWGDVFCGIAQHTKFIYADLSGGFDTRISIVPLLYSDVDLRKIQIHSIKADVHTYPEDYVIASQICQHWGLTLRPSAPDDNFLQLSLSDLFTIEKYTSQTFHKSSPIYQTKKLVNKRYSICGFSDGMRGYWHESPKEFIENQRQITRPYSKSLSQKLFHSIEQILKSNFRAVYSKRKIEDINSGYIPQYMYQETRCRHHYGKLGFLHGYQRNFFFTFSHTRPRFANFANKYSRMS